MNLSHFFIQRPILTTLIAFGILLFGIVGYRALPVAALPSVDYPTIQVQAALPGASPETMASSVATPLERQFSTIAGIDSMNSSNSLGSTNITVQFTLDRNIDAAAQDVQSAIAKAGGLLPPTMPRPPTFKKVNPAEQPVIYLALSSATLPLYTVDEYAETLMAQRISMVSGVSQVQGFRRRRNMPCACRWIPTRWRRAASASTKCKRAIADQQHQSSDRKTVWRTSRPSPSNPPAS